MNWMFESRSKNWFEDDAEGGNIFTALEYGFCELTQENHEKGGLEFPRLTLHRGQLT